MLNPTQEFVEWTEGADDEDLGIMTSLARKNMWKWLLISIIPIVNIFTVGIAIFCYDNLCFLKSRGHRGGNRILVTLMLIWGLVAVPLIELNFLRLNERLGDHILGWI